MEDEIQNGFPTDEASRNGFWDAFGRLTDTAVSVIGVVKGNKAQQQAAQQQAAVVQSNNSNLLRIVAIVAVVVLTGGLVYLFFRKK